MDAMPLWLSTTLLGMGTVFVGLICLIYITKLMSFLCKRQKPEKAAPAAARTQSAAPAVGDRAAFDAAVAAGIATYMGTSPAGLRILSIKKVN